MAKVQVFQRTFFWSAERSAVPSVAGCQRSPGSFAALGFIENRCVSDDQIYAPADVRNGAHSGEKDFAIFPKPTGASARFHT